MFEIMWYILYNPEQKNFHWAVHDRVWQVHGFTNFHSNSVKKIVDTIFGNLYQKNKPSNMYMTSFS